MYAEFQRSWQSMYLFQRCKQRGVDILIFAFMKEFVRGLDCKAEVTMKDLSVLTSLDYSLQAQAQCGDFLNKLSKVEEAAMSLEAAQAKELQDCQQEAKKAQQRIEEGEHENAALKEQMQSFEKEYEEKLTHALQVGSFGCFFCRYPARHRALTAQSNNYVSH